MCLYLIVLPIERCTFRSLAHSFINSFIIFSLFCWTMGDRLESVWGRDAVVGGLPMLMRLPQQLVGAWMRAYPASWNPVGERANAEERAALPAGLCSAATHTG